MRIAHQDKYTYPEHLVAQSTASFNSYLVAAIIHQRMGDDFDYSRMHTEGGDNLIVDFLTSRESQTVQNMFSIQPTAENTNKMLAQYGLAPLAEGELEKIMPLTHQKILQGIDRMCEWSGVNPQEIIPNAQPQPKATTFPQTETYQESIASTAQAAFNSYLTAAVVHNRVGHDYDFSKIHSDGGNNMIVSLITAKESASVQSMLAMKPAIEEVNNQLSYYGLAPLEQGELERVMPLAQQKVMQGIQHVCEWSGVNPQEILAPLPVQGQTNISAIINPQTTAANDAHIPPQSQNRG